MNHKTYKLLGPNSTRPGHEPCYTYSCCVCQDRSFVARCMGAERASQGAMQDRLNYPARPSSVSVHILRKTEPLAIMLGLAVTAPKRRWQLLQPLTHCFLKVIGALYAQEASHCTGKSHSIAASVQVACMTYYVTAEEVNVYGLPYIRHLAADSGCPTVAKQ